MESLELLILQNMLYNRDYFGKVIEYMEPDQFESWGYGRIAKMISYAYHKKNEIITPELLRVGCEGSTKLTKEQYEQLQVCYAQVVAHPNEQPLKLLLEETEKYFRTRRIRKSLADATISYDERKSVSPEILREIEDSVNFRFDEANTYNYLDNFQTRIDYYKENQKKVPFPIKAMNLITNGGMNDKSLTVCMASTGGGKSIFLCNCASSLMKRGYNVLYITCEMSVEEISKRIDADLLNAPQDCLVTQLSKEAIALRMEEIPDKDKWGNLWIKEYPAGVATSNMLLREMEEIERKSEKHIDVLVVDYINLLATSRYSTKNATSYTLVKAIAEELRGLGQEHEIPVITATQSNRSALNKETRGELGFEVVSESYGLPQTCDFMFNILEFVDNDKQMKRVFHILKNRWGDPSKRFITVNLNTGLARFSDDLSNPEATIEKPSGVSKSSSDLKGDEKLQSDRVKEQKTQEEADRIKNNTENNNIINNNLEHNLSELGL